MLILRTSSVLEAIMSSKIGLLAIEKILVKQLQRASPCSWISDRADFLKCFINTSLQIILKAMADVFLLIQLFVQALKREGGPLRLHLYGAQNFHFNGFSSLISNFSFVQVAFLKQSWKEVKLATCKYKNKILCFGKCINRKTHHTSQVHHALFNKISLGYPNKEEN